MGCSLLSGLWEVSFHLRHGPGEPWAPGTGLVTSCRRGGLPTWTLLLSMALQGIGCSPSQKIMLVKYQQGKGMKAQNILQNSDLSPCLESFHVFHLVTFVLAKRERLLQCLK